MQKAIEDVMLIEKERMDMVTIDDICEHVPQIRKSYWEIFHAEVPVPKTGYEDLFEEMHKSVDHLVNPQKKTFKEKYMEHTEWFKRMEEPYKDPDFSAPVDIPVPEEEKKKSEDEIKKKNLTQKYVKLNQHKS